ncbi:hypothetical protein [Flavobacterium caseinilyticum]|uniref:Uncharacterized protein n=1 Tax=Flavobacterium caseinilyticum TaxID=2541732 RepID=A0A4R5AWD8_9FLAO|nr:hypothetical protein [Flavobacterium caseinilyticum]TDD77133.1 hypothetical protein E0F89_05910 [Flavobacterium caseinilyticum]
MAFGINKEMESALENTATAEATATQTAAAEPTATTTEESVETTAEATNAAEASNDIIANHPTSTDEVALNDDQVRSYFKSKGREVENLDDLFQEKVKEVNPYEGINPELKAILDYNKETGRGLSDYQKLQQNIDEIPVLDLAVAKAKEETGMDLSAEDAQAYIEDVLGIDLSDLKDLSSVDKIKLNKFVKEYKAELKISQEKYKTPLATENVSGKEMVTLADGQQVEKTIFDEHQRTRQAYIEEMKVAVDSVAKTSLSMEFDNNGKKEVSTYEYEHDKEDKKNMFALTEDVDQTVAKLFRTEKGFDHQGLAKGIWRLDPKNWEKEVSAIVNKAVAENTERLLQNENNINYSRNRIASNGNASGSKDIFEKPRGFGVQFGI